MITPIQIDQYTRCTGNDDIPRSPIDNDRLRRWAADMVAELRREYDGTFSMTYTTSGDAMVVATIDVSGTIDVYYCRVQDNHYYNKDS